MSSLQAAFGRAQLARLDELLERKRADLPLVRGAPRRRPGRAPQPPDPAVHNTFWMVTVVVDRSPTGCRRGR